MGLVIVGAGGFGREVLDVLDASEPSVRSDFVGFVDDNEQTRPLVAALGEMLFGGLDLLLGSGHEYLVGIGNPAVRRSVDERLRRFGLRPAAPVRHRLASVGRNVGLQPGTVVCPGACLTTNIRAGQHLHVNLNATIGHDCVIGDFVTLAPAVNISGNVTVGDGVELGTGAVVLPGLTVGDGARVGAGAVVTKNVAAGTTVIGCPARPIGQR